MGHGAGGRLTQRLIRDIFLAHLGDPKEEGHDSEVVSLETAKVAVTTDGFVVRPLFFPGGDIGSLAVNGTANDLAMSGAVPKYFTASFILEEGFALSDLERIVVSMKRTAEANHVRLIAGDTKVVEQGKGDGVYLSLSGLGEVRHGLTIRGNAIREGDLILLSGDIGRHAIAVLNARDQLFPENEIVSDCAPLTFAVQALIGGGIEVHCLRDLTRGGLATALVELAEGSRFGFQIEEESIEVPPVVQSACDLMGFNPLYLANEGRFIAFVPAREAERAITLLKSNPISSAARIIGRVVAGGSPDVILKTPYGTARVVDRLSGEMLPRIC